MSDILFEGVEWIEKRSELESSYAFHRTERESAREILKEGFSPDQDSKAEKDERFLENAANELGLSYPVDRTESVFFYPSYELVDGSFGSRSRTCVLVVDTSRVSAPMWIADMDKYDSVISWTPREE